MKSKILLLVAVLSFGLSFSQTKLGTVNSDLIIGKMPQMQTVLKRVEKFAKQLDSTFQVKTTNYQTKVDAYKKTQATMTADDKKTKIEELASLELDMKKFRENGSKMLQLRRDEFMRPLYKKLSETIVEVAKENGYTQILTTQGNQFGYIDENYDITKLVMAKLGIQ